MKSVSSASVRGRAVPENDSRAGALSKPFVRQTDDSGACDLRMLEEIVLDLGGTDIFAAADDDLLAPADDAQIAVRVHDPRSPERI